MYKPIDFHPRDWLWYPEVVREIKQTAQKAAYMKAAIYNAYQRKYGEKKTELYQRLIEIQYIISEAWKVVIDWEQKGELKKYTKKIETEYNLKSKSLKLALDRIEGAYKEIKKEGQN